MKKIFVLFALLSILIGSAQETQFTKNYYLAKSKNQKTIGWILAAGGAGLIIAGIAVGESDDGNNDPNELDFGPNFDAGLWLVGGGIVSGLASIPFFISAGKNAQKAASISFGRQKILLPHGNLMVPRLQPAISTTIQF